jgi:hypothetical protein
MGTQSKIRINHKSTLRHYPNLATVDIRLYSMLHLILITCWTQGILANAIPSSPLQLCFGRVPTPIKHPFLRGELQRNFLIVGLHAPPVSFSGSYRGVEESILFPLGRQGVTSTWIYRMNVASGGLIKPSG